MKRKTLKQKMYEETRKIETIKIYNRDRTKVVREDVYETYLQQNQFNMPSYNGIEFSELEGEIYEAMLVINSLYDLGLFKEGTPLSKADKNRALEHKKEELAYYKKHGSPFSCAPKMLRMRPSLGIDRDTPRIENEIRLLGLLDFTKIRREPSEFPPYKVERLIERRSV